MKWLPSLLGLPLVLAWALTCQGSAAPAPDPADPYDFYTHQSGGWDSPLLSQALYALGPPDPQGPILLDHYHSFRRSPGQSAEEDSATLQEALQPFEGQIQMLNGPLNAFRLWGAAALILNLPMGDNPGYSQSEVLAITNFVGAGGGLLVIADNNDRAHHARMLEPLGKILGFSISPTTTQESNPTQLLGNPNAFRANSFNAHPITTGLRQFVVRSAGGVTGLSPLVQGSPESWSDQIGAKGVNNQFKEREDASQPALMAAGNYGQGRVVVIADRAAFSRELLPVEDNAQLFSNALAWLSQKTVAPRPSAALWVQDRVGGPGCASKGEDGFLKFRLEALEASLSTSKKQLHCGTEPSPTAANLLWLPGAALPEAGWKRGLFLLDPTDPQSQQLALQWGLVLGPKQAQNRLQWLVKEADFQEESPQYLASDLALKTYPAQVHCQNGEPLQNCGWTVWAQGEDAQPIVIERQQAVILLDPSLLRNQGLSPHGDPLSVRDRLAWRLAFYLSGV